MSAITNYVNNRTIRLNTPFKIINGVGYYVVNGSLVTQTKFHKQYPLKLVLSDKVDVDSRRNWIKD